MEQEELTDKIIVIKEQIEAKKGGEKLENWRYSQYKILSDEISDASGISISHTTLIRIFKKRETQNIPQISTLKALVVYLGYEGWEDFLKETSPQNKAEPHTAVRNHKQIKSILLYLSVTLIILISITSIFLLEEEVPKSSFYLELMNEKITHPQMITFKYKVPSDGYYLEVLPYSFLPYSTLKKKRSFDVPLDKEDSIINYKINVPDYFLAVIKKGEEKFATQEVKMNTDGWLGIIQSKERKTKNQGRFKNIVFTPALTEENLQIPAKFDKHIVSNQLDRYFETNFIYINDFDIDANAFIFETRFKNSCEQEFIAGQLNRVTLLTNNGLVEIPIINKANLQQAKVWFSEYIATYKKNIMHQYVVNDIANKWIALRIEIKDFTGKVYINNQLVDTIQYKQPLGLLTGIRYKFTDNGKVDYCKIMDHTGDTLFFDGFNNYISASETGVLNNNL